MTRTAETAAEVLIVTPVLNGAETIGRTLHSVAALAGPVRLAHHVQDGGSVDGTQALLERWSRLAAWGGVQSGSAEYRFSWSSSADRGLYDAVAKGFAAHAGGADQWLGWINADDVILPGATGLLAAINRDLGVDGPQWIGGRARAARDGHVVTEHDRPACRAIIQEGLCDGLYFPPIQQEGVFFRRALWSRIDPESDFARFRLAGDWNLWRAFAAFAPLHQVDLALGEFTIRPGQLSAVGAEDYRHEIECELPFEVRAEAFARLGRIGGLWRDRLAVQWPEGRVQVESETVDWIVSDATRRAEDRAVYAASDRQVSRAPLAGVAVAPIVKTHDGAVVGHDDDWQEPAATERCAFAKIVELWPAVDGWAYLGFPWATLIDLQNHWSPQRRALEAALAKAAAALPAGVRVVTVCQHIHARRIAPLMVGSGVTDMFWSHAEQGGETIGGLQVRPFPLFPVQRIEPGAAKQRDLLFSFVGAKADAWYPTATRTWIVDRLQGRRRGLIVERSSWHYERAVYAEQIRGEAAARRLDETEREAEFKSALARSVFVLCPSGSGPNTIRVWEALEAGAIPVILSDRWRPPGDRSLWEAAAIFRPETETAVKGLPRQLARLARNRGALDAYREAGRRLSAHYGPQSFVTDILELVKGG